MSDQSKSQDQQVDLEALTDRVAVILSGHGVNLRPSICTAIARDFLGAIAEQKAAEVLANQPTAEELEAVEIVPTDLRMETYRANRGGFDIRPDNCCRITHVPTGITITVNGDDNARSVHAAKAEAMRKLTVALAMRKETKSRLAPVSNVLQDAANMAHTYGQPELYQKLKLLMAALIPSQPGYIDDVALEAAGTILPLYFENIPGFTLKSKIQEAVSAAIGRAAVEQCAKLSRLALEEVLHLHTAVNAAAVRLRELKLDSLAKRLEDCAASTELVLRAPLVVQPTI